MTDLGKLFAHTASHIVDRYDGGFGSNKMYHALTLYKGDNYVLDSYYQDKYDLYEQLVKMGYLRKFVTDEIYAKTTSHHHVGHWEKRICYGLTRKGWEVAPQYLKAYKRVCALDEIRSLAESYVERYKGTSNPMTYEEAIQFVSSWSKYKDVI